MDSWLLSSSSFHRISLSLILLVMIFVEIPLSLCHDDFYSTCRNMFSCGNIKNIDFPFWGDIRPSDCGYPGLKLNCERSGVATIEIMKVNYSVLYVDLNSQILKISREDYRDGICSPVYVNSTLDPTLFDFGPGYQNLTLHYGCAPYPIHIPSEFTCDFVNGDVVHLELGDTGPLEDCNASVFVPIPSLVAPEIWMRLISLSKLEETIRDGFEVRWKGDTAGYCNHCKESMGVCGYDLNSNTPTCYHDNDHYTGTHT
ncbi:LEAF RUST 10 DISEASE-RESISTANCE LOCUS RECEPTOR-LIKE PROTEIN KINASE-like 1.3 [Carya illinoinensis]|nr:LEAF RUST 10 DISEASE-RESISTANCE LOCUS RECEPTOR-LIKE PROTEIN KINASE-like 1.3 [Carya illinoinensis]